MTLRNASPVRHTPSGLSDALDGSNVFQGAMSALVNLIPDPSTKNVWQCRPASILKGDFVAGGFSAPGFISLEITVGNRTFGMVATSANAGKDQPFCYDHDTDAFVAVTGYTNANTPASPATIGPWTPPTAAVVGTKVIVTHPGFTGAGGVKFGWFDISNPAAITWSGGDTATTNLAAVPTAVAAFADRAWYLVNPPTGQPAAYFSDVLVPTTITAGTQIITFDDNVKLTAAAGLPLSNQLGGIVQSLIVFKGTTNMYQITGDAASTSNPLARNALNVATGTNSPRSVCPTPKGLAFISPAGLRVIDFGARVSEPIGDAGMGVTIPFIYSEEPTRVAAACNSRVYRVSVQNGATTGTPWEEYWYDIPRGCWSGPHTFPASSISVWNDTFIMAAQGVGAKLFQSDTVQTPASVFVENGAQMGMLWKPVILPDTQAMAENEILECTINMVLASGGPIYAIQAVNQNGQLLNQVSVQADLATSIWGVFIWGQGVWQAAQTGLSPIRIDWTAPIVFRKLQISVQANCYLGFKIGDMYMRYQQLGYLQQTLVGA